MGCFKRDFSVCKITSNHVTVLLLVPLERHDLFCPDYSGH